MEKVAGKLFTRRTSPTATEKEPAKDAHEKGNRTHVKRKDVYNNNNNAAKTKTILTNNRQLLRCTI